MFNAIKFIASRRHRTWALGAAFFAAILVLLPIAAQAQCKNWDASGLWGIEQRGQQAAIGIQLTQKGRYLTGTATMNALRPSGPITKGFLVEVDGSVEGTIDGDVFSVEIFWKGGLTGVYTAKVLPSGRLDGETHDKSNPKISQTWHNLQPLNCLPPPVVQASVPPKPPPLKRTGKLPKSIPAPPPPMKVPGIVAGETVFPNLGSPTGLVLLSWDGGPDHPYAEIWVKVNNGDETFVVEQGKGGRQVTVQRGTLYEYILTDTGKTLATVKFVAH